MTHLEITVRAKGDAVTAIGQCSSLAKAYKDKIYLNFNEGFSITVKPESDVQDLISIWMLECKLIAAKKNNPAS